MLSEALGFGPSEASTGSAGASPAGSGSVSGPAAGAVLTAHGVDELLDGGRHLADGSVGFRILAGNSS